LDEENVLKREKNEAEYFRVKEQLVIEHHGQWIAFADGKVVNSGKIFGEISRTSPNDAFLVHCGFESEKTKAGTVFTITSRFFKDTSIM